MMWLWWFIPTLYVVVSLVLWVVTGRSEYREMVGNNSFATVYDDYGRGRTRKLNEEERLERCRKEAIKNNALAFIWPLALIALPFIGTYQGVKYLITSDVDKELEQKKQLAAAQKIVDDYNAKKKAEEEKVWAELEGKPIPEDRERRAVHELDCDCGTCLGL